MREVGIQVSTFPPIADYGLLSNCEQSCLVAPDGAVEWLCLPRPDSPSVFAALLDRSAGTFRFGPTNTQVPQQRRYVPGTMVLETTWQTGTGWMTVQDFLAVGPAGDGAQRPGRGHGELCPAVQLRHGRRRLELSGRGVQRDDGRRQGGGRAAAAGGQHPAGR